MDQLISISTTPIQLEHQVTNAKLNYSAEFGEMKISRKQGGFEFNNDPIKIKIDNTQSRYSLNMKTIKAFAKDVASSGKSSGLEATAKIVQEGNQLALPQRRITPADIAKRNLSQMKEFVMDFLPKGGANISWDGGNFSMDYNKDKMSMEINRSEVNFEYVPAKLEFIVSQYPRVDIEYTGDIIYFPASSDPKYVEPTLNMQA